MEFSRLHRNRTIVGAAATVLLVASLLFMPWFDLATNPQREAGAPDFNPDAFICGTGEFECTGWETFPILRWLLLLAALAPAILGWILVRGHTLSYPTGEMTMVAGFAAFVLIAYNGILDRPGSAVAETGVGLAYGYWIALASAAAIAIVGFLRSLEAGGRRGRKAPGTV
jgi:hypothetical protein